VKVVTKPDGTATPESVAEAAKTITTAATSVPSWGQIGAKPAASLLNDLYNVYYRAAVLAYIQERFDDVAQYLGAAGSAHPVDGMEANFDMERFGIHILGVCAKRREPAWWPDAIAATNTDSQKLVLKLADTYLHSQRPAKAVTVYQHLLAGDSSMGRPNKAVESYCLMQLALAYSVQRINYDKSIENYKRFLKKDYAEYSWAATAIMRLAVLEYNTTHDAKHAATYYQYVLERYPNHPNSERALYFLALAAVKLGDKTLAEASCHQYLDQYARSGWKNSGWRDHLQKILDNEIPRLSDNKGKQ
jgi:tetratricopeptide (TPR) repeat protein